MCIFIGNFASTHLILLTHILVITHHCFSSMDVHPSPNITPNLTEVQI
uniref:Uncharacterized protein n=1 Tax=Anguilla anguilla TaxID=7936 RepID=A0A0E9WRM4_ANGAN